MGERRFGLFGRPRAPCALRQGRGRRVRRGSHRGARVDLPAHYDLAIARTPLSIFHRAPGGACPSPQFGAGRRYWSRQSAEGPPFPHRTSPVPPAHGRPIPSLGGPPQIEGSGARLRARSPALLTFPGGCATWAKCFAVSVRCATAVETTGVIARLVFRRSAQIRGTSWRRRRVVAKHYECSSSGTRAA
jgi:hypothetical protein